MQQLTRLVRRTLLAPNAAHPTAAAATLSCAYASAFSATRSYATSTRAAKPTATVKKTVKAEAAAEPAPKKAAAAKKPAAKKTAVAKKPAAKKKKKTAAKKPAAKKKKARGRAKKVLTEEEKEKAKIRQYRIKALREPTSSRPITAYNVFLGEVTPKKPEGISSNDFLKEAVARFRNLTPAELEHYNQVARQKSEARKVEYKKWILSHTPNQIRIANVARATLRRKFADQKHGPAHTTRLIDDRQVKLAPTGYILFLKARHESGDMKNIKAIDATKLIASEWKALSPSEKQKYLDEAKALKQQQQQQQEEATTA